MKDKDLSKEADLNRLARMAVQSRAGEMEVRFRQAFNIENLNIKIKLFNDIIIERLSNYGKMDSYVFSMNNLDNMEKLSIKNRMNEFFISKKFKVLHIPTAPWKELAEEVKILSMALISAKIDNKIKTVEHYNKAINKIKTYRKEIPSENVQDNKGW